MGSIVAVSHRKSTFEILCVMDSTWLHSEQGVGAGAGGKDHITQLWNQFDNKFHIKKRQRERERDRKPTTTDAFIYLYIYFYLLSWLAAS